MKTNYLRIYLLGILATTSYLAGCQKYGQLLTQTNLDSSGNCPANPSKLTEVQEIELSDIPLSGMLKSGKDIGYKFVGKKGQKLVLNTENNLCFWIYKPTGERLNLEKTTELPMNGNYIIQLSTTQNFQFFSLNLNSENPPQPTIDLIGNWEGEFSNISQSELIIENQSNNLFTGTLITGDGGNYKIKIQGEIDLETYKIIMHEIEVLSEPNSGNWYLGVNTGTLSIDKYTISGTGKDSKGTEYVWSFQKQ